MATIIDTIRIDERMRRSWPELVPPLPFGGDGLLVILQAREDTDVSDAACKIATIVRPDGSRIKRPIAPFGA